MDLLAFLVRAGERQNPIKPSEYVCAYSLKTLWDLLGELKLSVLTRNLKINLLLTTSFTTFADAFP